MHFWRRCFHASKASWKSFSGMSFRADQAPASARYIDRVPMSSSFQDSSSSWPGPTPHWFPSLPTVLTSLQLTFLLPRLKGVMKGKHWDTIENIQAHVTSALKDIPEKDFQDALEAWKHRLQKCIDVGGCYFENF